MSLYVPRKKTDWLVIHCSATPPSMNIGAADIRRWHREKGWVDIGYHKVVRRDGKVEDGRPIDVVGAHVADFNSNSIGICLVGGVDIKGVPDDNFTDAQYSALAELLRDLRKKYPQTEVCGHRDFPGVKKACPSFDVAKWIKETGVFDISYAPDEKDAKTIEVTEDAPTYWSLSRKHKVDMWKLIEANPQKPPFALKIGDILKLPA